MSAVLARHRRPARQATRPAPDGRGRDREGPPGSRPRVVGSELRPARSCGGGSRRGRARSPQRTNDDADRGIQGFSSTRSRWVARPTRPSRRRTRARRERCRCEARQGTCGHWQARCRVMLGSRCLSLDDAPTVPIHLAGAPLGRTTRPPSRESCPIRLTPADRSGRSGAVPSGGCARARRRARGFLVTVNRPRDGYRSVTPRIVVDDVAAQVDFLRQVFGATADIEPGRPVEVHIGDSLVMVSSGVRTRQVRRVPVRLRR